MTLLEVHHLSAEFTSSRGIVRPVDDVSFEIPHGRTLAIVGESGCGKSTTALAVIGLLPRRTARITAGSVRFNGRDLTKLSPRELEDIRGPGIGTVFQDPLTSLNPGFTIGRQLIETIRRHRRVSKADAKARALEVLGEVRLPDPLRVFDAYPHQLSGGMRQRALISFALCVDPALLIADEPTTALDVTIQDEILDLLGRLRDERDMGMLLITHDMGVAAKTADEIAVMYAGEIVEIGPTDSLLGSPEHAYTNALLGSLPPIDGDDLRNARLTAIPGSPPDLHTPPGGDRFFARISGEPPPDPSVPSPAFAEVAPGHYARGGRSAVRV